ETYKYFLFHILFPPAVYPALYWGYFCPKIIKAGQQTHCPAVNIHFKLCQNFLRAGIREFK
ncbi:MAG: hypothetical protein J6B99_03070, partial [Oscillospiraceae bacterium]|nr:hypothetical protein [Oscillospiraceae bacterium]